MAMRFRWLIAIAVAAGIGATELALEREIPRAPGVLAPAEPKQEAIAVAPPTWTRAGYRITAVARFEATARVIRAERYRFDRESDLVPVDLALGWGPMSDSAVLRGLSFSQDHRFYFYHWSADPPIPPREMALNSANMHLIPASERIAKRLKKVRAGHVVRFSGYLVNATAGDGWTWATSLTRTDSGAGACELVWVEEFEAS
jgi:hypothetical protein